MVCCLYAPQAWVCIVTHFQAHHTAVQSGSVVPQAQAPMSKRHGLPLFLVELLLNAAIVAALYGVVTGYNAVSSVASAITNWLQKQTERLAPPLEQR